MPSSHHPIRFNQPSRRISWLYETYHGHAVQDERAFLDNINRIYYFHSASLYSQRHTLDISQQFTDLCSSIAQHTQPNMTVVNVGGGTGYEYSQLKRFGFNWSRYVYIEPSAVMADCFRQTAARHDATISILPGTLRHHIETVAAIPNKLIVTNSCLHHIVWIEEFLDDLKTALRPGDVLIFSHEPYNPYFGSPLMILNYAWRAMTSDLVLKRLGLLTSCNTATDNARWQRINEALLTEGITRKPIPAIALRRTIDYWVGTKGDWKALRIPPSHNEGFWDPYHLEDYLGSRLKRIYLRTYRHLGDPGDSLVLRSANNWLAGAMPLSGSIFSMALRCMA